MSVLDEALDVARTLVIAASIATVASVMRGRSRHTREECTVVGLAFADDELAFDDDELAFDDGESAIAADASMAAIGARRGFARSLMFAAIGAFCRALSRMRNASSAIGAAAAITARNEG
ncbi:MAG: hypothetical protein ACKV2T_14960 [Kofleriaceae bacterium]